MCLLKKTIKLAEAAPLETRRAACKHIGATERWLQQVMKGQTREPSVVKIENLNNYLSDLV